MQPPDVPSWSRHRPLGGLMAICVLAFSAADLRADTYTVCASGCDFATIQSSVSGATDGDTLLLLDPLYTEHGILVAKDLTLEGQGAASTIVQAAPDLASSIGRVFTVVLPGYLTLRHLTVRHGLEADGGGIHNSATLTLEHVDLKTNRAEGNSSGSGGGLFNSGQAVLDDVRFIDNVAQNRGGAVANAAPGSLTATGVAFTSNLLLFPSDGWGGVLWNGGRAELRQVDFTANQVLTVYEGVVVRGSVIASTAGTLELDDSVIAMNELGGIPVDAIRGAVLNLDTMHLQDVLIEDNAGLSAPDSSARRGVVHNLGTLTVVRSTVRGHHCTAGCPGIFSDGTLRVEGSTLSGNDLGILVEGGSADVVLSTVSGNGPHPEENGGGITLQDGTLRVASSTITDNVALNPSGNSGGGIHIENGTTELRNTIVSGNTDQSDLIYGRAHDCHGTITSHGWNIIGTLGSVLVQPGVLPCAIVGDPLGNQVGIDAGLLPLTDAEGPTETHPLAPTSSAIDNGNPFGCVDVDGATLLDEDQRGAPRISACDVGSFEYGSSLTIFSDDFESGDDTAWQ